jgi:hypothetical protein
MSDVMKKRGTLDDFLKKGGVVKRKGMPDYSYDTKYFLFVVEKVDKFLDEKVTYIDINDKGEEEEEEIQKRKTIWKKIGTLKFDTKEEALEKLDVRLKNISNKFKITKDMFEESVPPQIQKVDPDAQGLLFLKTVGENGRVLKHPGPQSKNQDSRAEKIVYDKLTYSYFFEYIVYKSNEIVKDNGDDMLNYLKKTYGKQ